MNTDTCELCRHKDERGITEIHHTIPIDITEQAGNPESKTIRLCRNCHREVHTWYSANVLDVSYDPESKRFIQKPIIEIIREYEVAYKVFSAYKNSQRDRY
ncbi:hypothetical protein ACFLVM_00910 [Chloroflexota bacterium]